MPKRPLTNIEAINKLNLLSLNYDFTKFKYNGDRTNESVVICPTHGKFKASYHNIFKSKYHNGLVCKKCRNEHQQNKIYSNLYGEGFLIKNHLINIINKLKYNNVDISKIPDDIQFYTNKSPIKLYCNEHGDFITSYNTLKNGIGCPDCMKENNHWGKRTYDIEYVHKLANERGAICLDDHYHGWNYSYTFICKHGNKFATTLRMIVDEDRNVWCNCKLCKPIRSSKGEDIIVDYLNEYNINYIKEKKFPDLKSDLNYNLSFDFYLPEHNILIEFDGKQHYVPVTYYGGEKTMLRIQTNDKRKNDYVENSSLLYLIRIPYNKKENINEILTEYITDSHKEKLYLIKP